MRIPKRIKRASDMRPSGFVLHLRILLQIRNFSEFRVPSFEGIPIFKSMTFIVSSRHPTRLALVRSFNFNWQVCSPWIPY